MVFIALPNMQAAQRNTQRRNDYNALATQITEFAANHNGKPPVVGDVKATWFNSRGEDADGNTYTSGANAANKAGYTVVNPFGGTATAPKRGGTSGGQAVYIYMNAICENGTPKKGSGTKEFVIYGYVESSANQDGTYCLASHM